MFTHAFSGLPTAYLLFKRAGLNQTDWRYDLNYKFIMKNVRGLTLIELMVTLAIFALVTMLALPGFQLYQQNSARVTNINDLVAALNLARSEAIKRGVQTMVCASANQATCSAINDWTTGWIAFIDDNNNATVDPTDGNGALDTAEGEPVILVHGALSGANLKFKDITNNSASIIFTSNGISTTSATFMRSDDRYITDPAANRNDHIRAIIVMNSGRIRLSRDSNDADTIHEDINNANMSGAL